MMTLVRHLPLFIGDLVDRDDDHWECFLLLWDICSVVCSFELTTDDATHLGVADRNVSGGFHESVWSFGDTKDALPVPSTKANTEMSFYFINITCTCTCSILL